MIGHLVGGFLGLDLAVDSQGLKISAVYSHGRQDHHYQDHGYFRVGYESD